MSLLPYLSSGIRDRITPREPDEIMELVWCRRPISAISRGPSCSFGDDCAGAAYRRVTGRLFFDNPDADSLYRAYLVNDRWWFAIVTNYYYIPPDILRAFLTAIEEPGVFYPDVSSRDTRYLQRISERRWTFKRRLEDKIDIDGLPLATKYERARC